MGPAQFRSVDELKALRVDIDAVIQNIELAGTHDGLETTNDDLYYMARGVARIKLIEAKMWVGKMLESLGNPFPPDLADKAPRE